MRGVSVLCPKAWGHGAGAEQQDGLWKQQLRCQARLHGRGHRVSSPSAPAVPGREQSAAGIGAGTVRAARDAIHI